MNYQDIIYQELKQSASVLESFMKDADNISMIEKAAKIISESIKKNGKIISCGNGGSSCDAMHFAEELTGRYRENRQPIPAIAISDSSHITCTANDYGYEEVFSRYVQALGQPGDILLAISTSGNSGNVLKAAEAAKAKGMFVVALSGKSGGELNALSDICIKVPHEGYADRIQEVHIKIIHVLIHLIEKSI